MTNRYAPLKRTYEKDGVIYIRPLGYDGKPTLTEQERQEVLDKHLPHLEALLRHRRFYKKDSK